MKLFAQIRKVDEAQRLVYGVAAEEVVDKSGEIMDYASSKPHFVKWSEEIARDTDGKSLGNVRAMHGKVAAGKLTALDFDDTTKRVEVCAKVVDDQEWGKVLEGVYTGFSIGGSYAEGSRKVEKMDGEDVTRYTAIPSEISLVDRPCIPTAKFFDVLKADGSLAKVDFKEPAAEKVDAMEPVDIVGTPAEIVQFGKLMNDLGLSMAQVIEKIAERKDTSAKEGESKYGNVAYADAENKKYPLDTEEHVKAAASYFGMAKNREKYSEADQKTIDDKIAAAEKKFSIGEKADFSLGLRKGMYTCGILANLIDSISYVQSSVEYEAEIERDNSPIAGQLADWMAEGGKILVAMVQEEVAELSAGEEAPEAVLNLAAKGGALCKALAADLEKAGARNNAADQKRIQAMHDHSTALGAKCEMDGKAAAAGALAKVDTPEELAKAEMASAIEKAVAAVAEPLTKQVTALLEKTEAQAAQIKKLEDQPAPTRVALRVVEKAQDIGGQPPANAEPKPIVDSGGQEHEAAGFIKSIHQQGGRPLTKIT